MLAKTQTDILDNKDYITIIEEDSDDGLYSYKVIDYNNEIKYKKE